MTDKQIIIDGVNVSGCTYINGEWCYADSEGYYGECMPRGKCEEYSDCYYKQLKRLQAEHELLQNQYNAVVEQNRQLQRELKEVK